MNKYCWMSIFILSACQSQIGTNTILERQNEQIIQYKKEMKQAEESLDQAASKLAQIQTDLHIAELEHIQTRIKSFENRLRSLQNTPQKYKDFLSKNLNKLFCKEREALNVMIATSLDESFCLQAQKVLDQILDLITTLREQHEDS